MLFFRKNKRRFSYRSHRKVFVAMFLLMFTAVSTFSLLFNVRAEDGPVASVEFNSVHSSFDQVDQGAWTVDKSAEWTGAGTARITFDVKSRNAYEEPKPKDIVLIVDKSGSMEGGKISQVQSDAGELVSSALQEDGNTISLITFSDSALTLVRFSNNEQFIQQEIESLMAVGGTNYTEAFSAANSLLDDYTNDGSRSLIILFLTDGLPNSSYEGVAQYRILKAKHPYATVHGIQYEMGEAIQKPIIAVSDRQFIADINTLNNILFKATFTTKYYSNFVLEDYIDDTYWSVINSSSIKADTGSATLSFDGPTPKITWNMSDVYRSGDTATLTIDIVLNEGYLENIDLLLPTNKRTVISSSIDGIDDEEVDEDNATPILKQAYEVRYLANAPASCTVSGTVPGTLKHSVFSIVERTDTGLSCPGYNFLGWQIKTSDVMRINNEYFFMPAYDVEIVGAWGKPSIEISFEGTPNVRASAKFDVGETVNMKIRAMSNEPDLENHQYKTDRNQIITGFVHSETLPSTLDINDSKNILSASDSAETIYGWFDDGVIYFYTDADDIYLNEDASKMFYALNKLYDINSLKYIHTDLTTDMSSMFCTYDLPIDTTEPFSTWNVSNVTNLSDFFDVMNGNIADASGLANWDVSNVTDMSWFFNSMKVTDLTAFKDWDTSKVTTMAGAFWGLRELTSLEGIEHFVGPSVTDIGSMFNRSMDHIDNLDDLSEWDVSNVTRMDYLFFSELGDDWEGERIYGLSDISGIAGWNVGKLENAALMFTGMNNLTDISVLSNWHPSNLNNTSRMFEMTGISTIDPLQNWDMSKVKYIEYMFYGDINLTHVANVNEETGEIYGGVSGWNTSNVESFAGVFSMAQNLNDIRGLRNWDTSKSTNFTNLFFGTAIDDVDEISGWDVSKVQSMRQMFAQSQVSDIEGLANWVTSSLKNVEWMFFQTKITNIGHLETDAETGDSIIVGGLSNWDMSKVTTMQGMFEQAAKLTSIIGATNWNTSSVTTMENMFYEAYSIESIDPVEKWDVSNVTKMGWMFDTLLKVKSISVLDAWKDKVGNVDDMQHMFSNMQKLESLDGLQNWDTSKVKTMFCMFDFTKELHSIDELANWNVEKVTTMGWMFRASGIEDVDALANWHPDSLTQIQDMFWQATNLTDISGISGWFNTDETSKIANLENTFSDTRITNLDALANWKTLNVTNMKTTFSNIPTLTNVDGLENWNTAKVTTMEGLFSGDTGITDVDAFSKINGWDTTKLTNKTDAFKDIPEDVIRPTWY